MIRDRRRPGLMRSVAGGPGRVLLVGLLGVGLLLAGAVLVVRQQSQPRFEAAGEVPAGQAVRSPRAPVVVATTGASSTRRATPSDKLATAPTGLVALEDKSFTPRRMRLPALAVDAVIVPVGLEAGGGLRIPDDPRTVGWWSGGAAPGSPVGTVLLAGHVDSAKTGPGALARLAGAPVGATVTVSGPGGQQTYVVQARRRYLKTALPWRSIFAQGERPRVVLVTCGGDFDYRTRHYTDNVVVFGTPA